MKIFSFLGFLLTAAGAYGLYLYFTEQDPFNFAENCNPYATASSCDNVGIGYLIIGLVCGGIGLVFMLVGMLASGARGREQKFMQRARPGMARIIAVTQPMNVTVNNQPMLTFELEVTPEGMSPFQHTLRTTVSPLVMSQVKLTPGSELPVKVDPDKPTNIRIDWAAAVMHQAQASATTSSV